MALQRAVYRPRDAEHTVLHQVIALHLEAFLEAVAGGRQRSGPAALGRARVPGVGYPPVASAPGVAGVRVRAVMSRGPGPRTGAPPPEGVDVGYPPDTVHNHSLLIMDSARSETA